MSILLDIFRLFAAIAVFLGHTNFYWFFSGHEMGFGPKNGQDYVIIFFVLSGFVISWSIDQKKNYNFSQYCFDRLTRLWSVVLPALFLGFLLDWFGKSLHAETYNPLVTKKFGELKYVLSGLFIHETWFFSVRPGSNGPFWSLSYEFFYYFIFGSFMLMKTTKSKIVVGLIACFAAGPKILLLLPCWLVGSISYYSCSKKRSVSFKLSVFVALTSFVLLFILLFQRWNSWNHTEFPELGTAPLFYSAKFLDDYLIASLVGLLLYSLSHWFTLEKKHSGIFAKLIKNCAKFSFSLYVIHFPIMAFLSAGLAKGVISGISHSEAIMVVLFSAYIFALIFEFPLKKYRSFVLRQFPFLREKCGIYS